MSNNANAAARLGILHLVKRYHMAFWAQHAAAAESPGAFLCNSIVANLS